MTPFSDLFDLLRALVGDRQVMSLWNYSDATLTSALRAVFLLGRGPAGFTLDPPTVVGTSIVPALTLGDAIALVACEAGLILIGGEDGKIAVRTRSMSVSDGGDRKHWLLWELQGRVDDIRAGCSYFTSYQNLVQYLGVQQKTADSALGPFLNPALVQLEAKAGVMSLTI